MTNEEKKILASARQHAVRLAWKEERARVLNGLGTRNWSLSEQKELIEKGYVKGYEGHHMKSVSEFPKYAGDPKNIQFLTEKEHLEGAHQGSYHNPTNSYYDADKKVFNEFERDELKEITVIELSEKYSFDIEKGTSATYEKDKKELNVSSLNQDLKNKELFSENKPGEYRYYSTSYGKVAEGHLIHEKGERNNQNQLNAGGADRRIDDDGGHLLSASNNASPGPENIDAQNKNLNRSSYKIHENIVNKEIDAGNKVYEHVETFKSNGSERPDVYMGYYIVENENGERDWEAFSYTNESANELEKWNQLIESMDLDETSAREDTISFTMVDDLNNEYDSLSGGNINQELEGGTTSSTMVDDLNNEYDSLSSGNINQELEEGTTSSAMVDDLDNEYIESISDANENFEYVDSSEDTANEQA